MGDTEWSDPNQRETVGFFVEQLQQTATRRGSVRACSYCQGFRVFVMVHAVTRKPFSVPCSACNPGGF